MKRLAFIIALVLVSTCILCGCSNVSENKKLAVCGSFAVPGMFCHDLKGGDFSCTVIERDRQGRILFLYEAANMITGQREKMYIISQEITSNSVRFYEDICYMSQDSAGDMEVFKTANSWNESLDSGRMSQREYSISVDLFIMTDLQLNHNKLKEAFCQTINIQESQVESLILLDVNQTGQEFLLFSVDVDGRLETYYAIADSNYEIAYEKTDLSSHKQVQKFKRENGWVYG